MKQEDCLLKLRLPGVAEFSIYGPLPQARRFASPALARTSIQSAHFAAQLCVLSEVVEGGRSIATNPFIFEQTPYQFDLALEAIDGPEVRMLLRGTDLLDGRRRIGPQPAYAIPVNFQSEVGFTEIELWRGTVRHFVLRSKFFRPSSTTGSDLLELRADLQMEVRSLLFELYGRTFRYFGVEAGAGQTTSTG